MKIANLLRTKALLRLLAGALLLGVAWAAVAGQASAMEAPGATEERSGFWWQLMHQIVTFNSRGLMATLSQPEYALAAFIAINLIVFVETGLLIGFFLPGDSLLVTVGLICSNPRCEWNLPLLLFTVSLSAIVGDTVGYLIGVKTGPSIFCREKSLLFNKDHLLKAQQFYDRHGGVTIILARFMPLLRTFAPVVAGVGRMDYRKFLAYNIVGGIGWVVSMVLAGYYLPAALNPPLRQLFGPEFLVQDHIEKIVIVVVLLSISPAAVAWLRSRLGGKTGAEPQLAEAVK
jgi:membrane-associated protein